MTSPVLKRPSLRLEAPQVVHVRLRGESTGMAAALAPRAERLARDHVADIGSLWEPLLTRNLATDQSGEA